MCVGRRGHMVAPCCRLAVYRRSVTIFAIIITLWIVCELLNSSRVTCAFVYDIVWSPGTVIIAKSPIPRSVLRYRLIDTNPTARPNALFLQRHTDRRSSSEDCLVVCLQSWWTLIYVVNISRVWSVIDRHYLYESFVSFICHVLGWCHVICALFIPEAWFGDTATMEPIILSRIPADRYNKVSGPFFHRLWMFPSANSVNKTMLVVSVNDDLVVSK